ncbi:MAG TPA: AgmX/PglI C-terminal domain-containing protein, partial [Labilithrix sp.]|nr:AgmX/PglI C-terminal domain-containing protein [Labilithrix sp.]
GKWGIGRGDKDGWGNGRGPGQGAHIPKAPRIRNPDVQTNGRIPPEVIQRIVRQNFGRFRLCYEAGLRDNPGLSGRVVTKFVIGRDGAVAQAQDAGSDLANQAVVSCVVRSFTSLSFPQPEGGIATVTYPIILNPGE